jgi:rod shape-determining protein MreD
MRYAFAAILLYVSVLIQSVMGPSLPLVGSRPDLPLVVVLAWAMLRGPGEGALIGFAGGLLLDSASYVPWGLNGALFGLGGYVTGLPEASVYRGNLPFFMVLAAVVTLLYHLAEFLSLQATGLGLPGLAMVARVAIPAAIMNAVLLAPTLIFCRRVLRALQGVKQLQL